MFNLEDFFNLSADLFCIIGHDGCLQTVNPAWQRVLGWKREDVIGHPWLEWVHPEDTAFSQLTTQPTQSFHLQNRYLCKHGDYQWLSWSLSISEQGLIYAVAKDISQQRQQIDALQTERQSLYNLLDQLPAFLYLQPKDYGVGFYNQRFREIFGEPKGRRCYETIAGLKHPCPTCPTFHVFDTNTPQLWEWVNSSTGRTYQIYDYPFKNMNGEPMVVEMGLDITAVKQAEAALKQRELDLIQKNQQLEQTLQELRKTQAQLIQTEKMSSLGQLVAGVAHEINNPVNFIFGNLTHANEYTQNLLGLLQLYQAQYPEPTPEIQEAIETIDSDFLIADLPKLLDSMKVGAERIRNIVHSLRNFSRLDEAEMKKVDIHSGIDSTLMILQNRLKAKHDYPEIKVIKEYGQLPLVECYAGQLNQVFMNILSNAIDALKESDEFSLLGADLNDRTDQSPTITIRTELVNADWVTIEFSDNGRGMSAEVQQRLFDPFFTTKPVGKGTGLGMSISYQIVTEKHQGHLLCSSAPGKGASFIIKIPTRQQKFLKSGGVGGTREMVSYNVSDF